jgi:hypothetical protein
MLGAVGIPFPAARGLMGDAGITRAATAIAVTDPARAVVPAGAFPGLLDAHERRHWERRDGGGHTGSLSAAICASIPDHVSSSTPDRRFAMYANTRSFGCGCGYFSDGLSLTAAPMTYDVDQ